MPSSATVRSGNRFAYQVTAVAVLAAVLAGCSSSRFSDSLVTGATDGGGSQPNYSQPMPPSLVGTNPIANGQPTALATPSGAVMVAGLPPANGGTPTNYTPSPQTVAPVAVATLPASLAAIHAALETCGRWHTVDKIFLLFSLATGVIMR